MTASKLGAAIALVAAAALVTTGAAEEPAARGVRAVAETPAAGVPVNRFWAVVVGVSSYAYAAKGIPNLSFAAADGRSFAALLRSASFGAGGIPAEQMQVLLDRDATLERVRGALLDFLGKAGRDDMVIVFFAGHGAPDPTRPEEMYLLVHDTDPERLASTGLAMRDVQGALARVNAQRVLLLADACHSAGIALPGARPRGLESNEVNQFLKELARVRHSRAVLTSSDVNERSLEMGRLQHGVFTWALLKALEGEADADHSGTVDLGEAVKYVRRTVENESNFRQHPVLAGDVDDRLPLARVAPTATDRIVTSRSPVKVPPRGRPTAAVDGPARISFDFDDELLSAEAPRSELSLPLVALPAPDHALPPAEASRIRPEAIAAERAWLDAGTALAAADANRLAAESRAQSAQAAAPAGEHPRLPEAQALDAAIAAVDQARARRLSAGAAARAALQQQVDAGGATHDRPGSSWVFLAEVIARGASERLQWAAEGTEAPASRPTSRIEETIPILKVTRARHNLDLAIGRGSAEGITIGAAGYLFGRGEKDGIGAAITGVRAEVTSAGEHDARVRLTADPKSDLSAIVPGAFLGLDGRLAPPVYRGILVELYAQDIELLDNSREPIVTLAQLVAATDSSVEENALAKMVECGHEVVPYTDKLGAPLDRPPYKGKTIKTILETASPEDYLRFLTFVHTFPGKYIGGRWKVSEVFATWLLNNAPPGGARAGAGSGSRPRLDDNEPQVTLFRNRMRADQAKRLAASDNPIAARLLDDYLARFPGHHLRADALYLRAALGDRAGLEAEPADGYLRALDQLPDSRHASDIDMRLGEIYDARPGARWLGLARESYLAAAASARRGSIVVAAAPLRLAWSLLRAGDDAGAQKAALEALAKLPTITDVPIQNRILADAIRLLARVARRVGDPATIEAAPLPAGTRDEILLRTGEGALDVGQPELAVRWLQRALDLASDTARAPRIDRLICKALEDAGRVDEAAQRLTMRLERYGTRSAWFKANAGVVRPGFLSDLHRDQLHGADLRESLARPPPSAGSPVTPMPTAPEIRRLLRARLLGRARDCFERELVRQSLHGRVVLRLDWATDGSLGAARIAADDLGASSIGQCVVNAAKAAGLDLPPSRFVVAATYPLVLQDAGE